MRTLRLSLVLVSLSGLLSAATPAAPAQDLQRTSLMYVERVAKAGEELAAVRARIAAEKLPLVNKGAALEERILALDAELGRLGFSKEQAQEHRRALAKEGDLLRRNIQYLNTLAGDGLACLDQSALPGEPAALLDATAASRRRLESPQAASDTSAALAVARLELERIRSGLGGRVSEGLALVGEDTTVVPGRFAFVGPEVFFASDDGRSRGVVRAREGSPLPVVHALPSWTAEHAAPLFKGAEASVPLDPSGGKALRLTEIKGSVLQHIHKGGVVAYAILCIGALSALLSLWKWLELRRLQVDPPGTMEELLRRMVGGSAEELRRAAAGLKGATRELVFLGIDLSGQSKELMEEGLAAHIARLRLHYERRLPLLAVIATASPLMGLLGTVMGMVKTFALITVFGTGSAAKLSSGISEVLVTTELGLAVAIPTLIIHGFLSHVVHKKLGLLERYSFELVLASRGAAPQPKLEVQGAGK
jgi:biopolymer transport protein ExbB